MQPLVANPRPGSVSRRSLLARGVATAAVAATGIGAGIGTGRAEGATVGPVTVRSLTAADPFYIAHRGGGRDWPAMTGYAYARAAKIPNLRAMEISVCISSDGVLVCSHNKTTTSMTGVPYTIIDETWRTLSALKVLPTYTVNPSQPARPFTRFDDVVERYIDDYVLFVEPKIKAALAPLMARMVGLGQPERVVWKQPINSKTFAVAKDHGFTTWGYVLDEPAHTGSNLQRYAASDDIDLLGAPDSESDAFATRIVSAAEDNGKQTVMWEIGSVAERTRALRLGCVGLMTSEVVGVLGTPV